MLGSSMGTLAKRAKWRLSCSFWELCMPGSSQRYDYQSAPHPRYGRREEGVGGHVQANVLHDGQRPHPAVGGSHGHLHGHLLVGGPLDVDALHLGQVLQYLRAGCPRIGGGHAQTGVVCSQSHGFVAGQQSLHLQLSPWTCPGMPASRRHLTAVPRRCLRALCGPSP